MPEVAEMPLSQRSAPLNFSDWLIFAAALCAIGITLRLSAGFELTHTLVVVAIQIATVLGLLKLAVKRGTILFATLWLGIPYLIFAFGWLHWLPAALLSVAILGLSWHINCKEKTHSAIDRDLLVALSLLYTWMNISGIGNVGHQSGDWVMHTGRLYDLIDHDWPVIYRDGLLINSEFWPASSALLVGYFGYQLPAALFGKLVNNHDLSLAFLSCWTWIGFIVLGLIIKNTFANIRVSAVALGLLFFSGTDVTLYHLNTFQQYTIDSYHYLLGAHNYSTAPLFELPFFYDFWSMKHFQFFFGAFLPLSLQFHFSPNQVIAVWVTCALLIHFAKDGANLSKGISCISLLFIWSPFGAISLSIFGATLIATQSWKNWRSSVYLPILPAIICSFAIFAIYYAAGIDHSGKAFQFSWQLNQDSSFTKKLILFHLYCWGVYAAILLASWQLLSPLHKRLFISTTSCLIALSFFNLGVANDLMVRGAAAPYFILLLIIISSAAILMERRAYFRLILLLLTITISSTSSLLMLQSNIKQFNNEKKSVSVINYPWGYEFLGSTKSPFMCYLSKQSCNDTTEQNTNQYDSSTKK